MARPRPCALALVALLLLSPALAEDKVGYNSVGSCITVTDETGDLFVTTVPASSEVWVDGGLSGTSSATVPGSYRVSLPPGEHKVEVRKADYTTYRFSACIQNNKITYLEVTLQFAPATPTPPPAPSPSAPSLSPSLSPTPSPIASPEATRAPNVTAPSLLAFLESSMADGQVTNSEEVALRAALDLLKGEGNASQTLFTPANASCRAIAASILRAVGGCAAVDPAGRPSIARACCSLPGPGTSPPPGPRKSPGFEVSAALAAVAVAAAMAKRRRRVD